MKIKIAVVLLFCLVLRLEAQTNTSNLVIWGGVSGLGEDITNALEVTTGYNHVLVLRNDGTLTNLVYPGGPDVEIPSDSNFVKIASSEFIDMALKSDGTLITWSRFGDFTSVPLDLTNIVSIAAGSYHQMALRVDGTVVSWGYNYSGETNVPVGLSNVVAISAGESFSLALKSNGKVVAWGSGATNVPTTLSNVVAISAGTYHALALRTNRKIVAWGENNYGQMTNLTTLSNVVSIYAGHHFSVVQMTNGSITVRGTGSVTNIPLDLPFVESLSSGSGASNICAVLVNPSKAGRPPTILSMFPVAQTRGIGSAAYMSVIADGFKPLKYRWYFGSTVIPGETNFILGLTNLLLSQSGLYKSVVSNGAGSVTSAPVALNVVLLSEVCVTPTVVLRGEIGATIRIDYIHLYDPTNAWITLDTVQVTNNPQLYFDTSAIGTPSRYYRLIQDP